MLSVLPDTNVWLALALSRHRHHSVAKAWLEAVDAPSAVWFCRATQQSLLRLLTTTAIFAPYGNRALTNAEAWDVYAAFSSDDRIRLWDDEPPGLERYWRELARRDDPSPKLWMDAYLAAFARAGRCRLVTTDRAFRQFPGLDLQVIGEPL